MLTGNRYLDATVADMTTITFALDVARPPMELKSVFELRKYKALTLYKLAAWE
jgi:hypothetical protein